MSSPEMQEVLRQLFEWREHAPANSSLEDMRDGFDRLWGAYSPQPGVDPVPVAAGGVSAAWLVAPDAANNRVIVYVHGGGFRVGSITSHVAITSRLTGAAKARVLALDYRLAPEHPFPAQIDDTVVRLHLVVGSGLRRRNTSR